MNSMDNTPTGMGFAHSELFTRRQAATYLGVAEQTLAVWKCLGRHSLPFIKIGRMVRYRKIDLDNFIVKHMHGVEQSRFS